jgi:uncharacterized membrane protein
MQKDRLAAFSDGVFAIIITIMVLDLKVPATPELAALCTVAPVFFAYVMSFIYVAIYWNNHHHMLHLVTRVNGGILWANMHLLFWLSLMPFATGWMGETGFAKAPTILYGVALLMPAIAYFVLQKVIIKSQGPDSRLAMAVGKDLKGKISPPLYLTGIGCGFISPLLACAIYVLVALIWLVPDRRIERLDGRD